MIACSKGSTRLLALHGDAFGRFTVCAPGDLGAMQQGLPVGAAKRFYLRIVQKGVENGCEHGKVRRVVGLAKSIV